MLFAYNAGTDPQHFLKGAIPGPKGGFQALKTARFVKLLQLFHLIA